MHPSYRSGARPRRGAWSPGLCPALIDHQSLPNRVYDRRSASATSPPTCLEPRRYNEFIGLAVMIDWGEEVFDRLRICRTIGYQFVVLCHFWMPKHGGHILEWTNCFTYYTVWDSHCMFIKSAAETNTCLFPVRNYRVKKVQCTNYLWSHSMLCRLNYCLLRSVTEYHGRYLY